MIGLRTGVVELSEHCTEWTERAASIMETIRSVLGSEVMGLEHVGSTAISEIPAKPIIDLAMVVVADADMPCIRDSLKDIGFEFRKRDLSGKELYRISSNDVRECFLHLMPEGHPDWERYILFRDRLNSDAKLRMDYASLKNELAKTFHDNPKRYVAGKTDFVSMVVNDNDRQHARSYFNQRWRSDGSADKVSDNLMESAFYGNAESLASLIFSFESLGLHREIDYEILLWNALTMGIDGIESKLVELYADGNGKYAYLPPEDFNWTVGILVDEKVSDSIRVLRQL